MRVKNSLLSILFLFVLPFGVNAQEFDPLFDKYCKLYGVSINLAKTIATVESGMNPWAVNIAGKGYMPVSKEEALKLVNMAHLSNQSYDVGLMQINRYWINKWQIAPEELLDPEENIKAGLTILGKEIARLGFTWEAIGKYHSPKEERGNRYAWQIYTKANSNSTNKKVVQYAKQKTSNQVPLLRNRTQLDKRKVDKGWIIRF